MDLNEKRNWYVVQVFTGKEELIKTECEKILAMPDTELFVPKYVRRKRIRGVLREDLLVLFPGYLFAITDEVEALWDNLKKVPNFTRILRSDVTFVPLEWEEIRFLKRFGKKDHVVEVSTGYKQGDEIIITEGPLKDYEGKIVKIDRHKRIAIIEVDFFGRTTQVKIGLEIFSMAQSQ